MAEKNSTVQKKGLIEVFTAGCRRGFNMSVNSIMPALVLGYVIIQFLQLSGLMDVISTVFRPFMGILGLPGEAVTVLVAAFLAKASGCAMAALMYSEGILTLGHCSILMPACMLMGTLIGGYARIIIVSGANRKWHTFLFLLPLLDAAIAMIIMRFVVATAGI
ncbi:nucleoside recognition protein [Pseudoflavonifractor sp. 60]|uniref:nucleoside recognition domain-containing protein n=1 Tax=Pseudoflavonifractor sp. 60 TaxID=2304576 RepID=UPI001369DCDD|nr:nucleoside recognition domain-containing protein [Pseudoflavonifractor sp. 60]MCI8547181.1 nucleoside recognition protein [Clostridia bacterium]NBI67312.1 nucleoside recognition protein [Pseudoflavonifractor sp. 60]